MTTAEPQKPVTELTVDAQADTTNQAPVSGFSAASTSLGGRVRKTTQTFTFTQAKSDEPEEFSPPVGKGVKVRDMEFVKNNVEALGKKQHDMIKQLYSIMYGRRFQQKNLKLIKEHILDFSGIIEQDEKSRENLVAKMGKWKLVFVHEAMDLLAVDRSKKSFDEEGKPHNKEALLDRLVDWLHNPQVTKEGQAESKQARQKAKTAKKSESEPSKKKRKTTKKKAVAADDEEEEEDDDHEVTESEGESSSDFEEAKKATKKRKVTQSDNEDDDEDEKDEAVDKDEEQRAADKDEEQPEEEASAADKEESKPEAEALDADVCTKVRDIIAQGNAEELTVKKIVRQLSADLGRDMSSQKKAIKEFITNDQAEI
ncbi:DEK, C-terminal [Phytophthora cactorum]|nr:DEK, C-terminal [Phytophthora cactorum]